MKEWFQLYCNFQENYASYNAHFRCESMDVHSGKVWAISFSMPKYHFLKKNWGFDVEDKKQSIEVN